MRPRRLLALLLVAAGVMLVSAPESALAHGLVGRQDLPIPKWLFGWGAAVVLVASFVALAVLWPKPVLERAPERRVAGLPRFLDPLAGALGIAMFVLVVYAGFAGSQASATNNLAPTVIFVLFWVAIPIVSLFLGDVFRALNPWRAAARAVAWLAAKLSRGGLPAPLPYPVRLGRWPAAIGILAFAWIELVYTGRGDPSNLAVLALVYVAIQSVGMSLYGIEPWNRYGDAFGVYFGLIARMSPLRWSRAGLFVRKPLSGLTTIDIVPGTVALICLIIGTTSFDGFSSGPAWGNIEPDLTNLFRDLGLGAANALQVSSTVGLLAVVLVVAGLYRLGVMGMQTVDPLGASAPELAARFAHSLVPIGLAYVVAHYFSLLVIEGQRMAYLVSDPLGTGANLFGTSSATVDYAWISASAIWYVQVAALVIGHVAGLVLAHERALVFFDGDSQVATRSQYWMLVVMIAFTSLGLWLLFAANA